MAKAKIGRPRSEKAQEAILRATQELLGETEGAELSIEAIARRAKVGRPTIYRWWPTLADVVLEALLRQAYTDIPVPSFVSLRQSLGEFLRLSVAVIEAGGGVHLRFLMAQAQRDAAFRERFRKGFVTQRREVLRSIFIKAAELGQFSVDRDLDLLVDMVFGTMWYRLLTGHAAMDASFADELTEAVIALVQPAPS